MFQLKILGATHIVISDPDIANELLALRGASYSERPRIVMLHELVSGEGNLGSSPPSRYWKNVRKLAAHTLTSGTLQVYNKFQTDEAARLILGLLNDVGNYEYLFERYSTTVTLLQLHGKRISRTAEEEKHVKTITTIVRTLERTGAPGAYLVDFIPMLKWLPSAFAAFKREAKELHNFEYSYFRGLTNEATIQYKSEKSKGSRAMMHHFLEKKDHYALSDFEIAYGLGTLLEGGSGTTSSAMQSFCLAMWHYPEWQTKMQKEIDQVVGNQRTPSFDDWPALPTVRAAMKETLRWRPVVPNGEYQPACSGIQLFRSLSLTEAGIPHMAKEADSYDGFHIPKGAIIHACQYAMFKDETRYPNAKDFNPDRWLNPNYPTFQSPLTEYPNLKRFAAFGFGRRICPGLVAAERSLFIEISMLMWACSVVKKLDSKGDVIPVSLEDYRAGNNTGPKTFSFNLEVRDPAKLEVLRQRSRSAKD